jgi:hypothetical protein
VRVVELYPGIRETAIEFVMGAAGFDLFLQAKQERRRRFGGVLTQEDYCSD